MPLTQAWGSDPGTGPTQRPGGLPAPPPEPTVSTPWKTQCAQGVLLMAECSSMACRRIDQPFNPMAIRVVLVLAPGLGKVVHGLSPPSSPAGPVRSPPGSGACPGRGPFLSPFPRGGESAASGSLGGGGGRVAARPDAQGPPPVGARRGRVRASVADEGTVQGEGYFSARGEILRPLQDRLRRRRSAGACSFDQG